MILKIRHKGLWLFHERGQEKGVDSRHVKRLRALLARLEASEKPEDMNFPGLRMHKLSGDLAGFYAVTVSANWRLIYRFEGENVTDVDLVDYH